MIASITIAYMPDLNSLQRQLHNLRTQVQSMLVVDNGPAGQAREELEKICKIEGATLIPMQFNTGIAFAQNFGIQHAITKGAEWILLMDQDSDPAENMVSLLHTALLSNPLAAAAGPSSVDQRSGRRSFFVLDNGWWPQQWAPKTADFSSPPLSVGFLIASGTLVRRTALPTPAPMRSEWFIDHVDSEWCLRTRSQGWILLGVPDAVLHHRLGDKVSRIWFLRWRQVAHHSALRDYYMFRNSILLARQSYVPLRWKLFFLSRLVQFAGFFLVFVPQRQHRMALMAQGLRDGLAGRTGPRL